MPDGVGLFTTRYPQGLRTDEQTGPGGSVCRLIVQNIVRRVVLGLPTGGEGRSEATQTHLGSVNRGEGRCETAEADLGSVNRAKGQSETAEADLGSVNHAKGRSET